MRLIKFLFAFFVSFGLFAQNQEFNCTVAVEAQLTGNENVQVFKTLEKQLNEFVNNTKWTDKTFKPQERIDCSMVIIVNAYNSDTFDASIQVSATRPVYNSTYSSPIYNINDRDFNFRYLEFQRLNFSNSQFESNLISVLAFHIYMILALDADTFELKGGDVYYDKVQEIVGYSQSEVTQGWEPPRRGDQTRSALITDITSTQFAEFRNILYEYHRLGLDVMSENVKEGKEKIAATLQQLMTMNRRRPNSYLFRTFFDAKAEEIQDIFSGGPTVNITELVESLQRVAPTHSSKWRSIKF